MSLCESFKKSRARSNFSIYQFLKRNFSLKYVPFIKTFPTDNLVNPMLTAAANGTTNGTTTPVDIHGQVQAAMSILSIGAGGIMSLRVPLKPEFCLQGGTFFGFFVRISADW